MTLALITGAQSFPLIQALVEKDWLAFGHPFSDRLGIPSVTGTGNVPLELSRQASTGSIPSSPMRQSSGSFASQSQSSSHSQNNYSPIFLQVHLLEKFRAASSPTDLFIVLRKYLSAILLFCELLDALAPFKYFKTSITK